MSVETLLQSAWVVVCGALVLLMQAGFLCLEAGFVRHKNSINVAIKNLVDLCFAAVSYFFIGYAFMFGATIHGLVGFSAPFLFGMDSSQLLSFFFQLTFCSTAATIVSGGIAERCRFLPYILISIFVGIFLYPVFGHWVWGGGWLSKLGYYDFAGSSVVHMLGGWVALAGVLRLGPRLGKFDSNGRSNRIPSSNLPMVALGVILLLFGWIGFNGGSASLGETTSLIIVNTVIAACFGGAFCLLSSWAFGGMAVVDLVLNGILGGLVAITAGANIVSPQAAAVIGLLGGLSVYGGTLLLEKLKIDDAVGAFPVHAVAGITGVLSVAVFCGSDFLQQMGISRGGFFVVQLIGVSACSVWAFSLGYLAWLFIDKTTQARIGPEEESIGMNFSEHGFPDAIHDLTQAVLKAGTMKVKPEDLEFPAEREYQNLYLAIRVMMKNAWEKVEGQSQWVDNVRGMTRELTSLLGEGAQLYGRDEANLKELRQSLYRIQSFFSENQKDNPLYLIFQDLIHHLMYRSGELDRSLVRANQRAKSILQKTGDLEKLAMEGWAK